jgi:hypothetical protein
MPPLSQPADERGAARLPPTPWPPLSPNTISVKVEGLVAPAVSNRGSATLRGYVDATCVLGPQYAARVNQDYRASRAGQRPAFMFLGFGCHAVSAVP